MKNFFLLARKAFWLAKTHPKWWVLAFVQLVLLGVLAVFWEKVSYNALIAIAWIAGYIVLMLVSLIFWTRVQSAEEQREILWQESSFSDFVLTALIALAAARIFMEFLLIWSLRSLASSLFFVSFLAAALGSVLLSVKLPLNFKLAFDLWRQKSLAMSGATFILLVFHSLFFALASLGLISIGELEVFSAFWVSATIVALFLLLLVFTTFALAWLNTFVVLGFLFLINTKKVKKPESLEQNAVVASSEVIN